MSFTETGTKMTLAQIPKTVFSFYRDGFAAMNLGRKLWMIIIIKLFVIFAVLKLFFFPDYLGTKFKTDRQRADYVIDRITLTGSADVSAQTDNIFAHHKQKEEN
jgi:hypothetical protein